MDADLTSVLVETEMHFGGMHTNVRRNKVSPHDPRTEKQISRGGMTGGDRMAHHGYASVYAAFLPKNPQVIVELGILRGVGLAIWDRIFPDADIIGLDVDISHCVDNLDSLRRAGAFQKMMPEVYEYDELMPNNANRLREILRGRSIDICIDDALHYDDAIIKSMRDLMPFMSDGGVYFIEDNNKVHMQIWRAFPKIIYMPFGKMTVIQC